MAGKDTLKKSAIVITSYKEIMPAIRAALDKHSIDIVSSYDSLHSISVIKKAIAQTGNTVFLRKAFSRFVNEWGPPELLILDEKTSLGPTSASKEDTSKILRTFIISFIIMQKTYEEKAHAHIVLIQTGNGKSAAESYEADPITILNILNSQNDTVNNIIAELKRQPDMFNTLFAFKAVSKKLPHDAIEGEISEFIERRASPSRGMSIATGEDGATMASSSALRDANIIERDRCDIVVRTDRSTVWINGREIPIESGSPYSNLSVFEIYAIGSWTARNQSEVADHINRTIRQRRLDTTDNAPSGLTLNLIRCEIEPAIITSLIEMVTRDKSRSRGIKISLNFKNATILENSPGYIMIRNSINHAY
jgi:hypothetical protein